MKTGYTIVVDVELICLIKHPIFSMVEQVVTSANDDALLGA